MGSTVFPAAGGGAVIRKQTTFTSSGTFTLPAGYGAGQPLLVDIEICGGGGGGGGGGREGTNQTGYGGSGGGSGIVAIYSNISLTANATITLGAGGAGGPGVASGSGGGTNGASGGASDVNSLYYAPGGGGGSFGSYYGNNFYRRGLGVNSYGFYILGGFVNGNAVTPGAGGGSGSVISNSQDASSQQMNYGGSHGSGGWQGPRDFTATSSQYDWDIYNAQFGQGINWSRSSTTSSPGTAVFPGGFTEISLLQRGAGGSGGNAANAETSGGGLAGTKTDGGRSGYSTSTSGAGSVTGQAASVAGCGGGGGGGRGTTGGASGAGGAGATGYCIITYWG